MVLIIFIQFLRDGGWQAGGIWRGEAVQRKEFLIAAFVMLGALASVVAVWQAYASRVHLGRFRVLVSKHCVVVSKAPFAVAYGYHSEGLKQFRWTNQGLQIIGRGGRVWVILPERWFDSDQVRRLRAGHERDDNSIQRDFYCGPYV